MSVGYSAVTWNPQKRRYDLAVAILVVVWIAGYVCTSLVVRPEATIETLLIRGFGTAAYFLLHLILAIGPLARLDSRFLPLLYNRRHLGVTMASLALVHGGLSIVQFHAFGVLDPLASVLASDGRWDGSTPLPFQPLGALALAILLLMAATSHDFWLATLTPPWWKRLHMLVYLAWALLVGHVTLGVLQVERSLLPVVLVAIGIATVVSLHLLAGWRELVPDREVQPRRDGLVVVGSFHDIPDGRAKVVTVGRERVAVFRFDNQVAAVSNVCRHQGGPLGEGQVIDGCITCPWHGFQYHPETGASPPPFTERVPTFQVHLEGDTVLVDPRPHPPGTRLEPARLPMVEL